MWMSFIVQETLLQKQNQILFIIVQEEIVNKNIKEKTVKISSQIKNLRILNYDMVKVTRQPKTGHTTVRFQ